MNCTVGFLQHRGGVLVLALALVFRAGFLQNPGGVIVVVLALSLALALALALALVLVLVLALALALTLVLTLVLVLVLAVCLGLLTIDHASLSRRSAVPSPNRITSNIWAHLTPIPVLQSSI